MFIHVTSVDEILVKNVVKMMAGELSMILSDIVDYRTTYS